MSCCKKTTNSPEYSIPEWAQTVKPHELAFYRYPLKELDDSLTGISAIAKTLHNMEISSACVPGAPDWWDGYLRGGLLTAIERLALAASVPLEEMLEIADEFAPKDDRAIPEPEHQIAVPVTDAEFVQLAALGSKYGLSADQMLERLLKDRLARETGK